MLSEHPHGFWLRTAWPGDTAAVWRGEGGGKSPADKHLDPAIVIQKEAAGGERWGGTRDGLGLLSGAQGGQVEVHRAVGGGVGCVANRLEPLAVRKEKSWLCRDASSLPDTCMPWPHPNPAGGKRSLSTDLTGETSPPHRVCAGRKGLGSEGLDTQEALRKNACHQLRQNAVYLHLSPKPSRYFPKSQHPFLSLSRPFRDPAEIRAISKLDTFGYRSSEGQPPPPQSQSFKFSCSAALWG